jgi:hypothetical protein
MVAASPTPARLSAINLYIFQYAPGQGGEAVPEEHRYSRALEWSVSACSMVNI